MSVIKKFFSNHLETKDNHQDPALNTRYYKTTKDKLIRHLLDMIEGNKDMTLIDHSVERGEVSVNITGKKKCFLVITVISVRPFRTAVDFSLAIDSGLNLGYGHQLINTIYDRIDKDFTRVEAASVNS